MCWVWSNFYQHGTPHLQRLHTLLQCVVYLVHNTCIITQETCTSEAAESTPNSILVLIKDHAIIFGNHSDNEDTPSSALSQNATYIFQNASGHHQNASDTRLNNRVRTVGNSSVRAPDGLNKYKNLGKAEKVIAERKAKNDEGKIAVSENGIRISAALWMSDGPHKPLKEVESFVPLPNAHWIIFCPRSNQFELSRLMRRQPWLEKCLTNCFSVYVIYLRRKILRQRNSTGKIHYFQGTIFTEYFISGRMSPATLTKHSKSAHLCITLMSRSLCPSFLLNMWKTILDQLNKSKSVGLKCDLYFRNLISM